MEAFARKGDAGFWKMVALIHGTGAAQAELTETVLVGYAGSLGIAPNQIQAALQLGTHKAAVDEDIRAASLAGINGTPAFTVNGYYISGAQPLEAFDRVIRRALADVKPK
jgi:predicted DsbA family dithiol-disulfide isomerase